jgi:hypothetical protein
LPGGQVGLSESSLAQHKISALNARRMIEGLRKADHTAVPRIGHVKVSLRIQRDPNGKK